MTRKFTKDSELAPMDRLTHRQLVLVEEYLLHGNIYEAARKAGYNGTTKEVIYNTGYKALRTKVVREAMAEIVAASMERAEVSVEKVLNDLERAKREAMIPFWDSNGNEKRDLPAFIKATELQGKYLKMFSDKIDLNVSGSLDVEHDLAKVPTEVLEKMLELYEQANGDAASDS